MSDKPNRPQNNPHADPHKKSSEKESTNRHVYVEPGVQIDLVKDLRKTYESSQTEATAHNKKQLLWTKISAGLLFIYAALAWWQGCSTQRSVTIAKNTMIVSQRAFLYAEKANVFNSSHIKSVVVLAPNTPAQVDVTFKNSGQTVASRFSSTIDFLFGDGIPENFTYPSSVRSQPTLVAPQAESHILKAISQQELADVESGKKALFVYGDVSYRDVFGTQHKTDYCFQYFGYSLKADGSIQEYIFYNGPLHNCADEECEANK